MDDATQTPDINWTEFKFHGVIRRVAIVGHWLGGQDMITETYSSYFGWHNRGSVVHLSAEYRAVAYAAIEGKG